MSINISNLNPTSNSYPNYNSKYSIMHTKSHTECKANGSYHANGLLCNSFRSRADNFMSSNTVVQQLKNAPANMEFMVSCNKGGDFEAQGTELNPHKKKTSKENKDKNVGIQLTKKTSATFEFPFAAILCYPNTTNSSTNNNLEQSNKFTSMFFTFHHTTLGLNTRNSCNYKESTFCNF